MTIYLSPWMPFSSAKYIAIEHTRYDLHGRMRAELCSSGANKNGEWCVIFTVDGGMTKWYSSRKEAKKAADEELLTMGYEFLNQERYDRLRLLV